MVSFQEEMILADLNELVGGKGAAQINQQLGLRSGWKSERVSGTEIRERLSVLATASQASAVAVERSSPTLSSGTRAPASGDGITMSKLSSENDGRAALEKRSAHLITGASGDDGSWTWNSMLSADEAQVLREKVVASLNVDEVEQLLAASPTRRVTDESNSRKNDQRAEHNTAINMPLGLQVCCIAILLLRAYKLVWGRHRKGGAG